MTEKCKICGRSDSQVLADAGTLGLLQEFQCGIYTCCQISEWADEQWLAWSKAADEDAITMPNRMIRSARIGLNRYLSPSAFVDLKCPGTEDPREDECHAQN